MLSNTLLEDLPISLKQCIQEKNPSHALLLRRRLCELGLDCHPHLGTQIVTILAESDCILPALHAFQKLDRRDSESWSSIFIGCIRHGHSRYALLLYERIHGDESVCLSPQAVVALLKACCALRDLQRGILLHRKVVSKGFLGSDVFIASTLISMYAKCSSLSLAQQLFDNLLFRNVVTWNALISGYAGHGFCEEAICCFHEMQHEGVRFSAVTLVCILKACGSVKNVFMGYELHTEVSEKGLCEANIFIGSAVVDMYANWGFLKTAQKVFDKLLNPDVVSWNALLSGYAEHGCSGDAFQCFDRMQHYGIIPTSVTYVSVLKAFVVQALVAMYCEHGHLYEAATILYELEIRNVIPWTSLISGCLEHRYHDKALCMFEQMQTVGVIPDHVALVLGLKACSSMGALDKGLGIHAEVTKKGLEKETTIGNTLINMYAECGVLPTTQFVFDTLQSQDLVSWNSLIAAYAHHGKSEKVFCILNIMLQERLVPDMVTVLNVLNTCSHTGLIEEAHLLFANANNGNCLNPRFEHYACMADLLGRAGLVDKAMTLLNDIPAHLDIALPHCNWSL